MPTALHVFILALAAAVYPTLLAGVIILLTRPEPAGQLTAFLLGGMTLSTIAGLLILVALQGSGQFDSSSQASYPIADIAIGVISLAAATAIVTGRPERIMNRPAQPVAAPAEAAGPSRTQRVLGGGSKPLIFALGALLNLPGVWYLAALKEISAANQSTAVDVLYVLGFNLVMFMLVEAPLLGYLLAPDRTRETIDRFSAWLRENKRRVAAGVAFAVGVYLVVKGVVNAVS